MNQRDKIGYQQGIVSIIVNTLLFLLKYWAGIVSGSVAIIADAWHTLSDSLSSVIVIGGVKLASKKPTKKHPFGYGRWEQIAAFFIAFLLAIVAYEFVRESIVKLETRESANYGLIAILVTLASILVKEGLAQYSFWTHRKTGNPTLKADGWHHRSDALSSVVVLVGIFLGRYWWWIDGALGIVISIMLLYAVYEILKEAITKILGEKPSDGLMEEIQKTIIRVHGSELQPHHFHIHNYGTHTELTFHIKLDENTDIKTGHTIATQIEKEIHQQMNIETTIHIEPRE
ncbi:MAG: cation diffusion facilitator family transporter [Bacteroidetes bacterium]|nr:cation diffusion facilitator family transporter [Bacteroidota bacterium]